MGPQNLEAGQDGRARVGGGVADDLDHLARNAHRLDGVAHGVGLGRGDRIVAGWRLDAKSRSLFRREARNQSAKRLMLIGRQP